MKKSFYFALALTAGLFASCSSDEIAQAPQGGLEINDNEAAKIQLNIGKIGGTTRGTGTVGDLTGEAGNVWAGQKFNLFMYEKGTFNPAQYKPTETSDPEDIFNNAELTAPANAISGQATYTVLLDPTDPTAGTTAQYSYYPATGSYSFWAYRIDDAGTGTGNVGVPAMYDATGAATTTEAEAMTVKVPFVIDGSQDLMIGVADTAAAAADLNAADSKIATDDEAAEKIYSAYAARRTVNPTLTFKHLLTRLTFQVKAATQDVSSAATAPSPLITGWEPGFKVTKVEVYSKSEGNIIAAWKGNAEDYNEMSERIEWTKASEKWDDATTLAPLELKSRQMAVLEKADIKMVPIAGNANGSIQYETGYTDGTHTGTWSASSLTAEQRAGDFVVYTTNALDDNTGMPTGAKTSLNTLGTATGYIATYNSTLGTKHAATTPTATLMNVPVYDTKADASKPLVALEPVVPGWTAGSTTYAWAASDATAYAGATAQGQFEVTSTTEADAIAEYTTAATAGDVDKVILLYNEVGGTAGTYDAGTDTPVAYIIGTSTTTGGSAVATNVGEALLVAPADANGYLVKVTYTRTKKVNSTTVQPLSDTAEITVVRKKDVAGVKTPTDFEAGKSYNVVVTLYSDGEAKSDTTLEGWENGDGLEDEYDAE